MLKGMITGLLTTATLPEVGTVIADFEVEDTEGTSLVLSELVEIGPVVVAFYPKAFTSG